MNRKRGHGDGEEGRGGAPPQKRAMTTQDGGKSGAPPKVQDALGYLEKVKKKFEASPHVYNQFLDIMKDFKAQTIDTDGVIRRVKTLFRGNRSLILGFNQFLPAGFKIDLDHNEIVDEEEAAKMERGAAREAEAKQPPSIEFHHAVQYVSKIKMRFKNQPDVYGEFLEILHDYQLKRTIDEVYSRVQTLFAGEDDLLEEFRYFLPDNGMVGPVVIQQKFHTQQKRGGRKPKPATSGNNNNSSSTSGRGRGRGGATTGTSRGNDRNKDNDSVTSESSKRASNTSNNNSSVGGRGSGYGSGSNANSGTPPSHTRFSDGKVRTGPNNNNGNNGMNTNTNNNNGNNNNSNGMSGNSSGNGGNPSLSSSTPSVSFPVGSEKEVTLFEKIRASIPKQNWNELIRILHMWTSRIINRHEMVRAIEDCLAEKSPEYLERVKQAISYDEHEEKGAVAPRSSYYAYAGSGVVDLSTCKEVSPSYRALPDDTPPPICTGRNRLAEEVLNDGIISIPTGSEDFSFKSTRKNIYEENLFRCEDERFELDMLIENNAAAVRMLEPLVALAVSLPIDQPKIIPLSPQFDILHIRAIARAYGDHGYEIIDLLKRSPAAAAPIILPRLRQKDEEWRRLKIEMKNQWRKIGDQNYTRSLDHRSFYFKQEDKKRCTSRSLMSELREAHERAFREEEPEDGPPLSTHSSMVATHHQGSARHHHQHNTVPLLATYSLRYTYDDGHIIHQQIFDALARVASAHLSESQQTDIFTFWNTFTHHIFGCRDVRQPLPTPPRGNTNARHSRRVGRRAAASASASGTGDRDDDDDDDDDIMAQAAAAAAEKKQKKKAAAAAKKRKAAKADDDDHDGADESPAVMDSDDDNNSKRGQTSRRGAAGAGGGTNNGARGGGRQTGTTSRKGKDGDKDDDNDDDDELDGDNDRARRRAQRPRGGTPNGDDDNTPIAGETPTNIPYVGRGGNVAGSTSSLLGEPYGIPTFGCSTSPSLAFFNLGDTKHDGTATGTATTTIPTLSSTTNNNNNGGVRPLRVSLSIWRDEEQRQPFRRHNRASRLFFGNQPYYVMFRLHQFLYERLLIAKDLAFKTKRRIRPGSKKKIPVTPEERYARFCELLFGLLDSTIDNNRFEDECRNLLGASSYVLFTVDKLLQQLLKQVQTIIGNDTCQKLQSLYYYETSRARGADLGLGHTITAPIITPTIPITATPTTSDNGNGLSATERSALLGRIYHTNCAALVGDDVCVQVEFFEDNNELGIGFVDPLPNHDAKDITKEWTAHIHRHISDTSSYTLPSDTLRPLLLRNARRVAASYHDDNNNGNGNNGSDGNNVLIMDGVTSYNRLICRPHLHTYAMTYDPHTEDVFIRRRVRAHIRGVQRSSTTSGGMDTSDDTSSSSSLSNNNASSLSLSSTMVAWATSRAHRRRHHRAFGDHGARTWLTKQFHDTTPHYDSNTQVWPPSAATAAATASSSSSSWPSQSPSPPPVASPQAANELMALGSGGHTITPTPLPSK